MLQTTFREKMESEGWHNVHIKKPSAPGMYRIYKRNGTIGKAYYLGNHLWRHSGGWEFCWWKDI